MMFTFWRLWKKGNTLKRGSSQMKTQFWSLKKQFLVANSLVKLGVWNSETGYFPGQCTCFWVGQLGLWAWQDKKGLGHLACPLDLDLLLAGPAVSWLCCCRMKSSWLLESEIQKSELPGLDSELKPGAVCCQAILALVCLCWTESRQRLEAQTSCLEASVHLRCPSVSSLIIKTLCVLDRLSGSHTNDHRKGLSLTGPSEIMCWLALYFLL